MIFKSHKSYIVSLCCAICLMFASPLLFAEPVQTAEEFLKSVADKTFDIIQSNASENNKIERLSAVFKENVNMDWMARFAIGKSWHQLSEDKRQEYLIAYKDYLLASYVSKFRDYNGQKFTLVGVKKSGNDFIVETQVVGPNSAPLAVAYRCALQQKWQVRDIVAEGVSMAGTQRAEFESMINKNGIDGLLERLRSITKEKALR